MKSLLFLIAGATAAAAFVIATRARAAAQQPVAVDELAHRLQDAWADHHTVA